MRKERPKTNVEVLLFHRYFRPIENILCALLEYFFSYLTQNYLVVCILLFVFMSKYITYSHVIVTFEKFYKPL